MKTGKSKIELLAPAKDLECGIAAINCGADAVYIGSEKYGARLAAGNSIENIEKLITYSHKYWAKVYVTVNTVFYDKELDEVEKLICRLYDIGADAIIIQDTSIFLMNLPPIPLFASTQMHNYSLDRIKFFEKAGIQRVILARELSLEQINEIRNNTELELEFFVHGALWFKRTMLFQLCCYRQKRQ
jgi:23S rRNA 5-hydroxycytidine C2501 synthase